MLWVTGNGTMPDGRAMLGSRVTVEEWNGLCPLLHAVTGKPEDCLAALPPELLDEESSPISPYGLLMALATRPEIAALLGLYWVDDDGFDEAGCDYYVTAHYKDMPAIESVVETANPLPLEVPRALVIGGLRPAVNRCGSGSTNTRSSAAGQIGLIWDIPRSGLSSSVAFPVTYNVCRKRSSDPDFIQINRAPDPSDEGAMVEEPVLIASLDPDDNASTDNWVLPDVLYRDELGPDPELGTYEYKITGVDIFGRESQPSASAEVTLVDLAGPATPRNIQVKAEQAPAVDDSAPRADVTLTWDWTKLEARDGADLASFRVYRRWGTNVLTDPRLGCPDDTQPDGGWTLQDMVPVGTNVTPIATAQDLENLPEADQATVGDLIPIDRYTFTEEVALPEGPAVQHVYYRIIAYDAGGNPGAVSAPVGTTVVDNRPATPPAAVKTLFSYNAWDDTVTVHLTWQTANATAAGGYKLLRTARHLECTDSADCPRDCDGDGCREGECTDSFCGGVDAGPDGPRQLDREAMLTNGVLPHNPQTISTQRSTLKSLAALGNLWTRVDDTGAAQAAAASCALDSVDTSSCDSDLDAAIGVGHTQYAHDVLPAAASGQVYFYRIMAVSRGGIQELDGDTGRTTISAAFPVQIPDFVPPRKPTWSKVVSRPHPSECSDDEDAVELSWRQDPARDTIGLGAGYRIWRERAPCSGDMDQLDDNASLIAPASVAVGIGSGVVTTDDADEPLPTFHLCDIPPLTETDYCYALELVDTAGNVSERSDAVVVRAIDTTRPAAPTVTAAWAGDVSEVAWTTAEPGLRVTVQRSAYGEAGPWRVLASEAVLVSPFQDAGAKPTKDYWYRVILHDTGGNASDRDEPVARVFLEATP